MWKPISSFFAGVRDFLRTEKPNGLEGAHTNTEEPAIRIAAIVKKTRDKALLAGLASEQNWVVHFRDTCEDGKKLVSSGKIPIVLFDREISGDEWRDMISAMAQSGHFVYAILISSVSDDYLWNEVMRHGGQDVLTSPLREEDVLRAVRLAWLYCHSTRKLQPMRQKQVPSGLSSRDR